MGKATVNTRDVKKSDRLHKQILAKERRAAAAGGNWAADQRKFEEQLAALSLSVKDIAKDGNCMFRAVGDQVYGNVDAHGRLRQECMNYLVEHKDDFAGFIDEEQDFETYVGKMRRSGVWAGHLELQLLSLMLKINIVVHQLGMPRWEITNFGPEVQVIHLSYHDGEHYNSVRAIGDRGGGVPIPIRITSRALPVADTQDANETELLVLRSTSCTSLTRVRELLREFEGDVDSVIEYLIAESAFGDEAADSEAVVVPSVPAPAPAPPPPPPPPPVPSVSKATPRKQTGPPQVPAAAPAAPAVAVPPVPVAAAAPAVVAPPAPVALAALLAPVALAAPIAAPIAAPAPAATTAPAPASAPTATVTPTEDTGPKRNDLCPCGSKLRYRKCCGMTHKPIVIKTSVNLTGAQRKLLAKQEKEAAAAEAKGSKKGRDHRRKQTTEDAAVVLPDLGSIRI